MQAITTKYLSATNTKPARIKASCQAGTIIISANDFERVQDAHESAANELRVKLRWIPSQSRMYGSHYSGTLPNGDMVWVITPQIRD